MFERLWRSRRARGTLSVCVAAAVAVLFGGDFGRAGTDAGVQLPPHPPTHRVPAIDGAQNPQLIPDVTVHSLFFRTLAHASDPEGQRRTVAYLKSAVLAPVSREDRLWRPVSDSEVSALQAHVAQYRDQVAGLDVAEAQARASRDAGKIAEIRQSRERLLGEFVAQLPAKVGDYAGNRILAYMNEKFRSKIRIFE